jgi:hypothetical protein
VIFVVPGASSFGHKIISTMSTKPIEAYAVISRRLMVTSPSAGSQGVRPRLAIYFYFSARADNVTEISGKNSPDSVRGPYNEVDRPCFFSRMIIFCRRSCVRYVRLEMIYE